MQRIKGIFAFTLFVGLLITAHPRSIFSQTQTTGSISGSVKDQTGAFLPGVEIKGQQEGTGQTHDAISTEVGTFTLALLPPGRYTVTFTLPGFQTIISRG